MLHNLSLLPLALLPVLAAENDTKVSRCCSELKSNLPGSVSLPGSSVYEAENADYYSALPADQMPACRVTPLSALDVSTALVTLSEGDCEFAVQSGGHMPWPNMNNIGAPGVTIDMGNLTTIRVDNTSSGPVVHVGPGQRWGTVYDELDKFNLTVVGGRAMTVGVGGYLLGGGLSYFNAQYGLAAQNVINYEIVLANGSIANVNHSSYPDLNQALNGGSTNFGIVTEYTIGTFPLVPIWGGFRNYALTEANQVAIINGTNFFMEAQLTDPLAGGVIFSYLRDFNKSDAEIAFAMLGEYFNGNGPLSDAFDPILAVPFLPGTDLIHNNTDQQDLAGQVDVRFVGGNRALFSTFTFAADLQFPQDMFEKARAMYNARFDNRSDVSWAASFQANGRAQWRKVAETPNFQDVETNRDLYVFVLISYSTNAEFDDALIEWHHEVMDWMIAEGQRRGLLSRWLYLNYARPDQDVYASFGEDNHAAMKRIKEEYDPGNILGRLWHGGFKL
ncbi:hypothetical protein DFH06DRAFT_1348713 [Mycena polygramma]|nr:hypothetical protein DFH06DRAFT_1348713 [Mycena polygramma]